jgi:uncharacterized lipoprotein NlpE involved in copper resistance
MYYSLTPDGKFNLNLVTGKQSATRHEQVPQNTRLVNLFPGICFIGGLLTFGFSL